MDNRNAPPRLTFYTPQGPRPALNRAAPHMPIVPRPTTPVARVASAKIPPKPLAVAQTALTGKPATRAVTRAQAPRKLSSWLDRGFETITGLNWHTYNHRHPNFHSVGPVVFSLIVVAGFGIIQLFNHDFYQLSPASQAVIGTINKPLTKKLSYDAHAKAFQYNEQAAAAAKPNSPQQAIAQASADQATSTKVGGGANNYAATLSAESAQGVKVQDTTDKTGQYAVSLVPQFKTREGKLVDGHVVYPVKGKDAQLVYSVKANGLKEDLVLPVTPGDAAEFAYKLNLPDSLQARLLPNGTVGIFSADSALFGDITYGSDADRAKVEAARAHGVKNHLVFVIPAPVITQTGKGSDTAKAEFTLDHDVLTIETSGLDSASYPISIDPSIVVTSAANSFTGGSLDGSIAIDGTTHQLMRGAVAGGTIGSFTSANTGASGYNGSSGAAQVSAIAYNGYLYVTGGSYNANTQRLATASYASISSSGVLGSWTSGGTFTNARASHGSVIYNGYLYVIGGINGGLLNDIQYAKIDPNNGSLGSWTPGGTFTTARWDFGAVAYNGFLYLIGGCSDGACNTTTDVRYAAFKADGSVSSTWNTGTAFPGSNGASLTASEYNGTIYAATTCTTGLACTGASSNIYYNILNADGSMGTWKTTTSYGAIMTNVRITASSGYLYMFGGYVGGVNQSTVRYAAIYADGTLGTWALTSNMVGPRMSGGVTSYNGYVFEVGGYSDNASNTIQQDSMYAKIDPAGGFGKFVTSPNAFTGTNVSRYGHGTVAYNGYLYVAGGYNPSAGYLSDVQIAAIAADGTIGTWSTTSSFSAVGSGARTFPGMVASNGYMYILGGINNAGAAISDVLYASINTSTGALGTWATTTALPGVRFAGAYAAYNNRIYVAAGCSSWNVVLTQCDGGSYLASSIYIAINTNGTLAGSWTTGTTLSTVRYESPAALMNGYIYVVGGLTTSVTQLASIEYAKINDDGSLSSWTTASVSLPAARASAAVAANKGYLYVSGGQTTGNGLLATTVYTTGNPDGSLNSWSPSSQTLSNARYLLSAAAIYNGNIYITGGYDSSVAYADTQIAPLNNGGTGGVPTSTTNTTTLPATRTSLASVAYNGFIYVIGGTDGTNLVQYASISNSGELGSFSAASSFIGSTRTYPNAVAYNGYIYLIGGYTASQSSADVQYAPINANGSLGTWHYTHASTDDGTTYVAGMPAAEFGGAVAVYNGFVYVTGGCTNFNSVSIACNTFSSVTYYAPFNANGTIGSWNPTSSFTTGRFGHTTVAVNGYLYVIGGCNAYNLAACTNATNYMNDVQYAKINANGTIGSWAYTTSFTNARYFHGSVAANGYLYIIGGIGATSGNVVADVQYAPINANGTIGDWTPTGSLTTAVWGAGYATTNGRIYVVAGQGGSALSSIQYAGQQAVAREGTYTYTSDLGGDLTATKLLIRGANSAGNSVSYKSATSASATFGSALNIPSYAAGSMISLNSLENRYRLLQFNIDDSQNAVFPDSQSSVGTISDFELFFHAASGNRLRGGKTFTGGSVKGLDAQPQ